MAINGLNGLVVGDADMVGLDAYHRSQLLVHLVDGQVAVPTPAYQEKPQVGELRGEWRGDASKFSVRHQVWIQIPRGEEDWGGKKRPRRQEQVDYGHLECRNDVSGNH